MLVRILLGIEYIIRSVHNECRAYHAKYSQHRESEWIERERERGGEGWVVEVLSCVLLKPLKAHNLKLNYMQGFGAVRVATGIRLDSVRSSIAV